MTDTRRLPVTRTLRFRVTALATLAVLAVLTVAGAVLVVVHRAVLVESLDEALLDRGAAVAADVRAGRPVAERDLRDDDVLVQVVAADGRVVASSSALADAPAWPPAESGTRIVDGVLPDGEAARIASLPAGPATVHVAAGLDDVGESTAALLRALLLAVPLGTVALAVLVWLLVGRVLRPVDAIRAEVDRISAARPDGRVPEPATGDEIARLARTMNAMLDRLARAVERQRRFVADAAHELRSPLARIRTELEVDRAHPAAADPQRTRETVLAEAERLQRLVDDLLLLARADAGALATDGGPVDLDEVVLASAAAHRVGPVVLDTSAVTPVQVRGDGGQLRRLVDNVLDNAVRHAAARVALEVTAEDDTAVLVVADDGPGIPAAAREAVFERFTRLDAARSHSGGAGLGLAIAREVAERHGGTLGLDGAGPGARFVLRLPLSSDPGKGRIGRSAAG